MRTKELIRLALREDIGSGDITTNAIIPKDQKAKAIIIAKEAGVISGLLVAKEVFHQVDRRIKFAPKVKDGAHAKKRKVIAALTGPARGILTGERVALNFLQHFSGIATLTYKFKNQISKIKNKVILLDTRKTLPGLRALEKYAVRMGGGANHRFGLFDAFLIKDSHLKLAGSIREAIRPIKAREGGRRHKAIEVEAKTIFQVKQAIEGGADKILLDNMSLKTLRRAVGLCKKAGVWVEASGGVNLTNVRRIAATGVDAVSVGALTHSAGALDLSLKVA